MTNATPDKSPLDAPALIDALRRADFDAAGRLLAGSDADGGRLATLAEGFVRRRRWRDAEWLFGRIEPREPAAEMKRLLSRNMAALQSHRPEVYEQLVALPASEAYGIAPAAAAGRPTIVTRRPDGSPVSLSGGPDPLAAARDALDKVRESSPRGESVALCGLGDGYLLQLLAQNPPPLFMDTQQAVFVLEPQPQVLLHVLMIHDLAGPCGPIAGERFRWFVGPGWAAALDGAIDLEPTIGVPGVLLQQGLDGAAVQARVQASVQSVIGRDADVKREVEAYYAEMTAGDFAALLGPNPPRTPRVMLLTTRFSTVLQYSTRDAAEAFRGMGWDAHVVIEPSPSHRLFPFAIRRALAAFKPDLLVQLDHLRHEHGDLFPASLPFACWAQDHLPNLTSAAAASRVGPRDFVLVGMPQMYAARYGYPRRQALALTKLTRLPQLPASWRSDGEDLVYVSTASQSAVDLANQLLAQHPPAVHPVMRACAERMIEHYARGGALPTQHDVRLFVQRVEKAIGVRVDDPQLRTAMTDALFDRLGNLLYRQQALGWAAAIASRHGLKLGIYGSGWEAHPTLAPFARGPVQYGAALEALTRRSRINLVLEPFFAPSHQRLLDGVAAGGFFLLREHPTNTLIPELWQFLVRHGSGDSSSVAQVRDALAPDERRAFDDLVARAGCLGEFGDPVEFVRDVRAAEVFRDEGEAVPDLASVSFCDRSSMEARVVEFLGSAQRRREIASRQRQSIEQHLSYGAGMTRVVREIGRLLADEAALGAARATPRNREAA